jgi:hypothetical protein
MSLRPATAVAGSGATDAERRLMICAPATRPFQREPTLCPLAALGTLALARSSFVGGRVDSDFSSPLPPIPSDAGSAVRDVGDARLGL